MDTLIVQIGNSDDKLTQLEWSDYFEEVDQSITTWANTIHFSGCSQGSMPWQNACWVFEIDAGKISFLATALTVIRSRYRQESVALNFTTETKFI